MIPLRLYIEGFRSFSSPIEIDFSELKLTSITGPNGSGKSSLIEAMLFALFNKVRTRTIKKAISYNHKKILCELDFQADSGKFRIRRHRGEKSHDAQIFHFDGEDYRLLPIDKITDINNHIVKLIGMPYESFVKSSVLLQGEAGSFSELSPSERMTFFSSLLHLELFDDISVECHARSKNQASLIQNAQKRFDSLSDKLEDLGYMERSHGEKITKLAEADEEIDKLKDESKKLIEKKLHRAKLSAQIASLEKQRDISRKQYHEKLDKKKKLSVQHEIIATILKKSAEIEQNYQQYQESIEKEKSLSKIRDEIQKTESRIKDKKHEQEIILNEFASKVSILESEEKALREQLNEINDRILKRPIIESGLKKLQDSRNNLDQLQENQKSSLELERKLQKLNSELDKKTALVKQKIRNLEEDKNILEDTARRLEDADLWLSDLEESIQERSVIEKRTKNISIAIASKEEAIRNVIKQIDTIDSEINEITEKSNLMKTQTGGNCPLCGTNLNPQHKSKILANWKAEITAKDSQKIELSRSKIEFRDQLESLQTKMDTAIENIAKKDHLQKQLTDIKADIKQRDNAKKRLSEINDEIYKLKKSKNYADFAIEISNEIKSIENALANLGYSEDKLKHAMYKVENLSHFASDMETLKRDEEIIDKVGIKLAHKLDELEQLKEEHGKKQSIEQIEKEIEQLTESINGMEYSEDKYSECRKRIDDLKDAPEKMEKLKNAITNLENLKIEMDVIVKDLEILENQGIDLNREIEDADKKIKDMDSIEQNIDKNNQMLKEKSIERDKIRDEINSLKTSILRQREYREELTKLDNEMDSTKRGLENSEILKRLCSRHGVQKFLVSRMLPLIERESNHILSKLLPGVDISFSTDANYGLDLIIDRNGDESPYESLSGGERFRVDFALRIALSRLIAMRYGQKVSTLIIDEGFGTQDQEGLSLMVDSLLEIRTEFEKIFIITHLEALKSEFPTNIAISRQPDSGSQLKIRYI